MTAEGLFDWLCVCTCVLSLCMCVCVVCVCCVDVGVCCVSGVRVYCQCVCVCVVCVRMRECMCMCISMINIVIIATNSIRFINTVNLIITIIVIPDHQKVGTRRDRVVSNARIFHHVRVENTILLTRTSLLQLSTSK